MVGQRPLPYLLSELFLFFLTHTHTTSTYTYIFEIFTFLHVEAKIIACTLLDNRKIIYQFPLLLCVCSFVVFHFMNFTTFVISFYSMTPR